MALWGWIDTVKKTSENIISIYKEDLQEFTKEITTDTATVIAATASPNADAGIGKQLTAGITSLFNGEATTSSPSTTSSTDVSKSRREKLLEALQLDPKTYTTDPSEEEEFKTWHANFTLESRTKDISHLLATNPKLRAIHNELLPTVTYVVFWERYFYRLDKLNREEQRREAILRRVERDESQLEDWGWGEEEEAEARPTASATEENSSSSSPAPIPESGEEEKKPETEVESKKEEEPIASDGGHVVEAVKVEDQSEGDDEAVARPQEAQSETVVEEEPTPTAPEVQEEHETKKEEHVEEAIAAPLPELNAEPLPGVVAETDDDIEAEIIKRASQLQQGGTADAAVEEEGWDSWE